MIHVQIENQKYILGETDSFYQLKISALKASGYIIEHFLFEDNIIGDEVLSKYFSGKSIIGRTTDERKYEQHGNNKHSYRCVKCRRNLNFGTLKCKHSDKCRSLKNKAKEMSMSESLSRISQNISNFGDESLGNFIKADFNHVDDVIKEINKANEEKEEKRHVINKFNEIPEANEHEEKYYFFKNFRSICFAQHKEKLFEFDKMKSLYEVKEEKKCEEK